VLRAGGVRANGPRLHLSGVAKLPTEGAMSSVKWARPVESVSTLMSPYGSWKVSSVLAGPPTTKTRCRAKVIWSPFCTWLRKAASRPRVSVALPPFGRVRVDPADM
jgi:hypothetical protein